MPGSGPSCESPVERIPSGPNSSKAKTWSRKRSRISSIRPSRRVPRQLQPRLDQLLQRHIDQVRRIVLRLHRLIDRLRRDLTGPLLVTHDTQPLADEIALPCGRTHRVVPRLYTLLQPRQAPHMLHHRLRHLRQVREVAQLLETLQQHHQRQHMLRRPSLPPRPRHLGGSVNGTV